MRSLPMVSVRLCVLAISIFAWPVLSSAQSDEASLRIDLGGGQVIELVRVEPGTFQQGSPAEQAIRNPDETPHSVALRKAFYLGKFPVTRGQFARFANEVQYRTEAETGPSGGFGWDGMQLSQRKEFTWKTPGFAQTDEHPVTIVTIKDAQAFLGWLSRKTGRAFSLPTEAQWEYSARAGSTTAFPSGNDSKRLNSEAWFKQNAGNGTRPVGQKALNAWGLGDMLGNVWQWCDDWYAPYPEGDASDPRQTQSNLSDKPRRVLRGGSWLKEANACRPAARYRNDPASRNADNGFRVMTFDAAPKVEPAVNLPPARANGSPQSAPAQPQSDRIEPVAPPKAPLASSDAALPTGASDAEPAGLPIANGSADPKVEGSRSGGFLVLFILLAILVIGGIILIFFVRKIIGAFRGGGGRGQAPGGFSGSGPGIGSSMVPGLGVGGPIRTRIVDDGFWIESNEIPAGTVLECRYFAGGRQNQSNVTFDGGAGGKFVFTGSRPSSVAVAVLPGSLPSTMNPPPLGGGRMRSPYQQGFTDDDPPAFHGHPPAY